MREAVHLEGSLKTRRHAPDDQCAEAISRSSERATAIALIHEGEPIDTAVDTHRRANRRAISEGPTESGFFFPLTKCMSVC